MIWPEFRIHNTIFGMRHILATYYTNIYIRLFLAFISMYLADLTTSRFGSKEIRTTNSIPFPKGIYVSTITNVASVTLLTDKYSGPYYTTSNGPQ